MKTLFLTLLWVALATGLSGEPYSATGTINDDGVRIRAEPGTTSEILGKLNRGTIVAVQDIDNFQSTNSGVEYWVKVAQNEVTGWVFGSFIDIRDKLVLTYDAAGGNLKLNTYESSVYAVSPQTVLLDANLNPVKTIPFGTELLLAQGTMIHLPPEYEPYLSRKFVLAAHQIEAYCPIQTLDDREIYLVAEKDVSPTLVSSAESAYFLKRYYWFSTNYAFGKQLFVLPKPSLLELRGRTQRTLWASPSNVSDSAVSADAILAFTTVDGLFICRRVSYGGRIGAGGGWTSSVDILRNVNGTLQFLKSLELDHFED